MVRFVRYMVVLCWLVGGPIQTSRAVDDIIPASAGVSVVDWKDAGKYLDKEIIVQGKIVETKDIGTISFLNFDAAHSFCAIIRESNYKNFPKPAVRMYDQQTVRIHGVISEFKGKPQIEVIRPDQIVILQQPSPVPVKVDPKSKTFNGIVTVSTFNTLNLFDDYDDPYHADEGTPAKPKEQLEKLAATIHTVNADVIALEEVENRGYLERFVRAYLGDMGYAHVVCIDSNDQRGIDCAVLSRLPVGPVTTYRHLRFPDGDGDEMKFRRDLLQVSIEPPGYTAFTVFVVHFKSKRGGSDTTTKYRLGEARQARKIMDHLLSLDADAAFLICGDFNDTWDSKPLAALKGQGKTALGNFLADLPQGAETFNKRPGGMIDFILTSPALTKRYVLKSYRIIAGSVEASGSDHNPVLAQFDLSLKN